MPPDHGAAAVRTILTDPDLRGVLPLDKLHVPRKLRAKIRRGDFEVQVINQSWHLPTLDEAKLLGLKTRQKALIREVLLLCHGTPWVYARSVIPHPSLEGELRFLRKLKNSALEDELLVALRLLSFLKIDKKVSQEAGNIKCQILKPY